MTSALSLFGQTCVPSDVDLSGTASDYSKLAGLLAGFAFSSFFIVVVRRLDLKTISSIAHVAELLLATFLCLVLTSLNYAVLAGEPLVDDRSTGRATSAAVVAGLGFIMSGVLLLYALIVALDAADESARAAEPSDQTESSADPDPDKGLLASLARRLRATTAIFLAPLFMMLAFASTTDYRAANPESDGWLVSFGWTLLAAQVAISGLAAFQWRDRSRAALQEAHFSSTYVRLTIAVVLSCTAGFQLIFLIDPCESIATGWIAVTLAVAFVSLAGTTLVAGGYSPRAWQRRRLPRGSD